ncbi:hypothetical protein RFI_16652 [Reticulomyxa filosa]|uniref:C2H2-type domain-containing protein n=1 Tax=Reticulomyxa filosa TaxID=46433 RepID=X6N2S1_RETFI|nr:hypothetical protein RFI_16652 [Reticulomyxa filosa]|eukprot:ETO20565.1 hypothetical protein RFI_16652 [Reticulomyxa filosa]
MDKDKFGLVNLYTDNSSTLATIRFANKRNIPLTEKLINVTDNDKRTDKEISELAEAEEGPVFCLYADCCCAVRCKRQGFQAKEKYPGEYTIILAYLEERQGIFFPVFSESLDSKLLDKKVRYCEPREYDGKNASELSDFLPVFMASELSVFQFIKNKICKLMFPMASRKKTIDIFIPQQSSTVIENEKSYIRKNALMMTFDFCKRWDEENFDEDVKKVQKYLANNKDFIYEWIKIINSLDGSGFLLYTLKGMCTETYLYSLSEKKNFRKIIRQDKRLVENKSKNLNWGNIQKLITAKIVQKLPTDIREYICTFISLENTIRMPKTSLEIFVILEFILINLCKLFFLKVVSFFNYMMNNLSDIDEDFVMEDLQEKVKIEKVRSIVKNMRCANLHPSITAIISLIDVTAHEIISFDPFIFYNSAIGLYIDNSKSCLTYERFYESILEYGSMPKPTQKCIDYNGWIYETPRHPKEIGIMMNKITFPMYFSNYFKGRPRTKIPIERAMLITLTGKWEIERRETMASKYCQKRIERVFVFVFTPVTEKVDEFTSGDLLKDAKLLEILENSLDKYIGWVLHIVRRDETGMLKFKLLHLLCQSSVYSEYQYWVKIVGDYPLKECMVHRTAYDEATNTYSEKSYNVIVFNYTSAYCDSCGHLYESPKEFENHHNRGHCKEYSEAIDIIRLSYRMRIPKDILNLIIDFKDHLYCLKKLTSDERTLVLALYANIRSMNDRGDLFLQHTVRRNYSKNTILKEV